MFTLIAIPAGLFVLVLITRISRKRYALEQNRDMRKHVRRLSNTKVEE